MEAEVPQPLLLEKREPMSRIKMSETRPDHDAMMTTPSPRSLSSTSARESQADGVSRYQPHAAI
jgi:hypothetical protein